MRTDHGREFKDSLIFLVMGWHRGLDERRGRSLPCGMANSRHFYVFTVARFGGPRSEGEFAGSVKPRALKMGTLGLDSVVTFGSMCRLRPEVRLLKGFARGYF
jgi:hypothetical protein